MNNKELQDLLKQYPDDTPVMITICTKRNSELSCLKFDFTTIDLTSGKTRCIELIGEVEKIKAICATRSRVALIARLRMI